MTATTMLYLSNYAVLNVKDELAKIDGVGDVRVLVPVNFHCECGSIPKKLPASI